MEQYQSRWWQLAAIQIGGAICLPIFVVGHTLSAKFGFLSAMMAVGIGNGLLLILGLAAAHYSVKTRMTTAETAADAFGSHGKLYFALILILSMMGWFSIQLDLMGLMVNNILGINSPKAMNVALGIVITVFGLRGFRGMEMLANVCLPLLVLTIGYAIFEVSKGPGKVIFEEAIAFGGISLALAAAIGVVIDMPTFFRRAKNSKDALIATILLFGIALPVLEGVGIYLASQGVGENIIEALATENSSGVWKGWVAFFIILAGWTTNNTNLYSAAIALKTVLKVTRDSYCQVALGIGATLFSLFNIQENLSHFLEYLGVLLASAGGVMLVHQMTSGRTNKACNSVGLAVGVLAGGISSMGFEISGFGMVDAFGFSFLVSALGGLIAYNYKNKEETSYEIC
jgi:cytosine permease